MFVVNPSAYDKLLIIKLLYKCIDLTVEILLFGGEGGSGWAGVFRISMDVHCSTGMRVRPKSDGYGYALGGIGIFYLFSGCHK